MNAAAHTHATVPETSGPPLAPKRRRTAVPTTAGVVVARPRQNGTKQTVTALRDPRRWRRSSLPGGDECIEFDEVGDGTGWEMRFRVSERGAIAGRGLFAARDYLPGEYLTCYMGDDIGGAGTESGRAAVNRLVAIHRADHIMEIGGRYVDGRRARNGAQFANTACGVTGRNDNAKFSGTTGSLRVAENCTGGGIRCGQEILLTYGTGYWNTRARTAKRAGRDERRGGAIAYSLHNDGRDVFVEELLTSREVRGRGMCTGHALCSYMLERLPDSAHTVHLLVLQSNAHAMALYEQLGFETTTTHAIYAPRDGVDEVSMSVSVTYMRQRLQQRRSPTCAWERECAPNVARLRGEDARWVQRMYEEAYAGQGKRWKRDHAQDVHHMVMWDGSGVGGESSGWAAADTAAHDTGGSGDGGGHAPTEGGGGGVDTKARRGAPSGRQRTTTGAASPGEITHAITLRGAQLTWAVLHGAKRIENRHFRIAPGWYALHTGAKMDSVDSQRPLLRKLTGVPGEAKLPHLAIVGAVRISHDLAFEECQHDEWAFGPICNVISEVMELSQPVPHRGALSVWEVRPDALERIRQQLHAITGCRINDTTHLPARSTMPLRPIREMRVRDGAGYNSAVPSATASTIDASTRTAPTPTNAPVSVTAPVSTRQGEAAWLPTTAGTATSSTARTVAEGRCPTDADERQRATTPACADHEASARIAAGGKSVKRRRAAQDTVGPGTLASKAARTVDDGNGTIVERGGAAQTPALNTGAETQCQFSSVQVSSVQVAPQETAAAAAGIAAASVTSDDANADTVRATTGVNGERDGTATHPRGGRDAARTSAHGTSLRRAEYEGTATDT